MLSADLTLGKGEDFWLVEAVWDRLELFVD